MQISSVSCKTQQGMLRKTINDWVVQYFFYNRMSRNIKFSVHFVNGKLTTLIFDDCGKQNLQMTVKFLFIIL